MRTTLAVAVVGWGLWAANAESPNHDEGPKSRDYVLVPTRASGVILFVGREARPDEKFPDNVRHNILIGGVRRTIVRLKEGDRVEKGQLLVCLDDTLIRKEVEIRDGRVAIAEAELGLARKILAEGTLRYQRVLKLLAPSFGKEEIDAFKSEYERQVQEEKIKRLGVEIARRELEKAKAQLALHEIRSPVAGVVQAVLHRTGEAVRQYEPVVRIKFDDDRP